MLSTFTNPLTPHQQQFLRAAAEAAYPNEACGLFLTDGGMVELTNRSPVPEQFVISATDYARYDEQIAVCWHTHTNYPRFSPADIKACKTLGLPFALWDCGSSTASWLDPRQTVGLVGRPWAYGVWDCYAAVRDWHYQNSGLVMGDYPRTAEGEWHSSSFTHFEDNFRTEGFEPVPAGAPLERGDVLLFRIRNQQTSNHVAVLEDPAQGLLFHHLVGRLSEVGLYSHWLRENTHLVVRRHAC